MEDSDALIIRHQFTGISKINFLYDQEKVVFINGRVDGYNLI